MNHLNLKIKKTFKELNQWIEQLEEEVEIEEGTNDEPPKPKDKDDDAKAFASIRKWQEKK